MSRLLQHFGIDGRQFRALLRLAWRIDMRGSKMGFGIQGKGRNPKLTFLATTFFYLLIGFIFAQFNYNAGNAFLGATVTVGGILFMLGGMMLVEYNTIVISPDDYHILGYRPVASRTYFLAKLTNILIYMITFTFMLGGPTILVHGFRGGFSLERLLAASVAIFGAGFAVSIGVVVIYGFLLRKISPARLRNVIAYTQFAMSLVIYAGYLVLPNLLQEYAADAQITKTAWLLAAPTSWFAAIVELGYGEHGAFNLAGAGLALLCLLILIRGAISRISLDYAHRIALLSEQPDTSPAQTRQRAKRRWPTWLGLFSQPESRVVARLVYSQFKYDTRFKISVLGIIPLLLLYLFMGLRESSFPNPFVTGSEGMLQFLAFFFALLMIPMIVKQNLETSEAYESSWIFYASPARLPLIVIATRNLLFVLFTLPCLLLIFALFAYYFDHLGQALLHTLTITAISFIFLQIIYIFRPKLPFAEPKIRGGRSRLFTVMFFLLPALGLWILHLITSNFYDSFVELGMVYAVLILLMLVLERIIRWRIYEASRTLQYEK